MSAETFAEGLRALLDEYERRGGRITALELENAAWQQDKAALLARIAELEAAQPTEPEPPTPRRKLKYAPPVLDNPLDLEIQPIGRAQVITLQAGRDYRLHMPHVVDGGVTIKGGRNWTLVGGEINIPWQGSNPTIAQRTGLRFYQHTGTAHVEGVLLRGEDISEGMQTNCPEGIVQIQNVRVENIHARDQQTFKDNHPDILQTWGNCRELRVDGLTGSSDYQGILLKADYNPPHGAVTLRRVNIIGTPTARYLFWVHQQAGAGDVALEDVWIDIPPAREAGLGFAKSVMPDRDTGKLIIDPPNTARWQDMTPVIHGVVREGAPTGGDFVPVGLAGVGYVSPGYFGDATPTPSATVAPSSTPTDEPTATSTPEPTLTPSEAPTATLTPIPTSTPTDAPPSATSAPQWAFTVYFNDGFTASFWCDLTAELLGRFNVAHSIACPVQ